MQDLIDKDHIWKWLKLWEAKRLIERRVMEYHFQYGFHPKIYIPKTTRMEHNMEGLED